MVWAGTFYVCFSAHRGSTSGLLLFQFPSGVDGNLEISKCLNTLFLLSPYLCLIIGFFCDLFITRNDPWMSKKTSTRTEQIFFTSMEAEGESWDTVKLA